MRDFTPEEAKDEIELLKIIIKFLQNRGFAWDMFLRPFRLMYYKHQLKILEKKNGRIKATKNLHKGSSEKVL